MKKPTIAEFILILIATLTLLFMVYQAYFNENETEITTNPINLVEVNDMHKVFYSSLFNSSITYEKDFLSEVEVYSNPHSNYSINDKIEIIVKLCSLSSSENARARAFFLDPRGIIQYQYPNNIQNDLLSDDGRVDLNTLLKFKIHHSLISSRHLSGEWQFILIILNDDNNIISEVVEPFDIYYPTESIQKTDNIIFIIDLIKIPVILFLLIIILFFVAKRYKQSILNLINTIGNPKEKARLEEFQSYEKLKRKTNKISDPLLILALKELNGIIDIDSEIQYEGRNLKTGHAVRVTSVNAGRIFKELIELNYAKISDKKIELTEKGKEFYNYLKNNGYVIDVINDKILTKGYIPLSKRRKSE